MRIVHVISGLEMGGTENLLCDLSLAHARGGTDVQVVSLTSRGPVGDQLRAAGVSVHSLGLRAGSFNALPLMRLVAWLRHDRPDVVQTWMYHANLLGGLAARLAGRVPLVWGLHHVLGADAIELKPSTLQIARFGAGLSAIIPDRIICCGQAAMHSHVDRGYAAQRMMVISNGVDVNRFRPDVSARRALRTELGVDAATPLIGMFARYHREKDHPTFIRAAARLHETRPEVHFVLCGAGVDSANAELSAQLEAAGLMRVFHLLGVRGDLPRLFGGLDLAALSSRSEAFPLVLCEAMACGIPCVATDVGDCAYIIGDAGRVVPAGDAPRFASACLDVLRLQPSEYASLGVRARQRVCSEFDLQITARRYLELYRELVDRKRLRSRPSN